MSDLTRSTRPIYRNIHIGQIIAYRLPPAGIASILHRISGAILFLLLPFALWMFDRSLTSELSFGTFKAVTSNWFAKLVVLALLWAFTYHFVSGVRHLVMDLHLGLEKDSSRKSALTVIGISIVFELAFALKIFGAF